jgi:glycosyltransferase involved in cell wall biosynthesis
MFCSVVIPTIGRSTLIRAINSVLNQTLLDDDFEVIVVNDSGQELQYEEWQDSPKVRVINTQKRERSFARNAGAAVAVGDYLNFLDDDDWLLPGAIDHLSTLACQENNAVWLYGGIQVVDESGKILGEVNSGLNGKCFAQIMGGAWAPMQASLIKTKTFFKVGGFTPSICGTEDLDLSRRIACLGDFASTPHPVACLYRGKTWDTSTNYHRAADDTKRSRNRVLNEQGVFKRLLSSVRTSDNSNYWYGRILRVYLSTVDFNLTHRRLFAAMSRGIFSLAWVILAGWRIFSRVFWHGVKAHHVPDTLHFIMEKYERSIKINAL